MRIPVVFTWMAAIAAVPAFAADAAPSFAKDVAPIFETNCSGCHSHGGGGMGPPLMDSQWIYGSDAANIFATIVEGRPNGMPSFGSKLPPDSIWKLATYVRSLSGLEPQVQPNFPIHGTPAAHTNDVPEALKKYYSEIESSP